MTWTYLTTRTDLEPGSWIDTGKGSMVVRERVSATQYRISPPTFWESVRALLIELGRHVCLRIQGWWLDAQLYRLDVAQRRADRAELLRAGLARPPAPFWQLVFWRLGF